MIQKRDILYILGFIIFGVLAITNILINEYSDEIEKKVDCYDKNNNKIIGVSCIHYDKYYYNHNIENIVDTIQLILIIDLVIMAILLMLEIGGYIGN